MAIGSHREALRPVWGSGIGGKVGVLGWFGRGHGKGGDSAVLALSYVNPSFILRLSFVYVALIIRYRFYMNIPDIAFF